MVAGQDRSGNPELGREPMKKLVLLLACFAVAVFGAEWTGYISCASCGAKHGDGSQSSVDCVKACIKAGAKPVLVVGDKVVRISNAEKTPLDLYGRKVTVTGTLKGDTIQIASIAAAK